MRKITKESVEAFLNNKNFKQHGYNKRVCGSTSIIMEVASDQFTNRMWLHGNLIAVKDHVNNVLKVSLAGWNTKVTRERLNGIPGVSIHTVKGVPILNGQVIEDDKFYIV